MLLLLKNMFARILKETIANGSLITLLKIRNAIFREILSIYRLYLAKIFQKRYFTLQNNKLKYFYHKYNNTFDNERIIEIPIVLFLMKKYKIFNYYELGNVLSNYGICGHPIIDKYDEDKSIIKEDIVSYNKPNSISNMISISTLEHVGWDEEIRSPNKIALAIDNILNKLLLKGGYFIFTVPIGYNPYLDEYLKINRHLMFSHFTLIRTSKSNEWIEVDFEKCIEKKFSSPFNNANGLFIGIFINN